VGNFSVNNNMRILTKTLIGAIALSSFLVKATAQSSDPYMAMENEVLQLVNQHRTDMGLQPLQMDTLITTAALQHSVDMANGTVPFGHDGFDERTGGIMSKIKPSNAAAENVALGDTSAAEAVDLWLHSPGHKKNIEGNYNLTGIGIVKSPSGDLYFTQIFIHQGR
jgi:uncharacterized protein YkwD